MGDIRGKEVERTTKERAFWEKIAGNYDNSSKFEEAYKLSIEKVKKVLKSDHKVLEIACGTGIIALGIADKVSHVVGIDISPKMIQIAKEKAARLSITNVDFLESDGYALQYDDNAFDAILLFNVLHIVKEPNRVLSEAYRLLKPNGYLITATDCYAEQASILKKMNVLLPRLLKRFGVIKYLSFFNKKDIVDLLQINSYQVIECDVLHNAPVNFYVLAQKK